LPKIKHIVPPPNFWAGYVTDKVICALPNATAGLLWWS